MNSFPNNDNSCHYSMINYLYFKFNMALKQNHAHPIWEKEGESFMPCTEAYKEHIMYTFNGFSKTVICFAAINA